MNFTLELFNTSTDTPTVSDQMSNMICPECIYWSKGYISTLVVLCVETFGLIGAMLYQGYQCKKTKAKQSHTNLFPQNVVPMEVVIEPPHKTPPPTPN